MFRTTRDGRVCCVAATENALCPACRADRRQGRVAPGVGATVPEPPDLSAALRRARHDTRTPEQRRAERLHEFLRPPAPPAEPTEATRTAARRAVEAQYQGVPPPIDLNVQIRERRRG